MINTTSASRRTTRRGSRRRTRSILAEGMRVVAVMAFVLATASTAHSQSRSLDIREMNAQIVVSRSGAVTVTERFVVQFNGSWNGIYRSIPLEYPAPGGLNYTLRLHIASVTDDSGTPLRHEVDRVGDSRRVKMWVPGAENATRTIVLTYRSDNALRFFEEYDELYWNVTGDEWDFPIQNVTAVVMLPEDVTGLRTSSFTGARGSTEVAAPVEQVGTTFTFRGTRPLGYREGLTIVVGWNPGIIERPTATDKAVSVLMSNSILLAPIVAFLVMLTLWRRFGRDPDPGSVLVRYEPPPDMSPAEAGTLMDDRADMRDITATLVDLAVRGFVRIDEKTKDQLFGLISSRDYEITLVHPERWPQLKPHERALLQALSVHSHQDSVLLSDLKNEFYKHLPEIRKHLSRTLVDGGFYVSRPDIVRVLWVAIAIGSATAVVIVGGVLSTRFGINGGATAVAGGATFIVVAAFGWFMPRRTATGARMHTWLRGFEEFLGRVEKDRLERLVDSPALFEKLLPYAMAFGVETNWARAFEGLATQPPAWYHTADGRAFRPNLFVADLGRMTTEANTAMSSAPRSSGSSGSSGFSGGSSGGGFGGGGGGGF